MRVLAALCLLIGLVRCSPVPTTDCDTVDSTQKQETPLTDEQLKAQGIELMKKFDNISVTVSKYTKLVIPTDSEDLRAANISMTCVVLKRVVGKIEEDYKNDPSYKNAIDQAMNQTTAKHCQDPVTQANYHMILIGIFTDTLMLVAHDIGKLAIENSFEEYLKQAKGPEVRKYFEDNLAVIRGTNITKKFEKGKKAAYENANLIHNEQHETLMNAMNVYWNKKEHTDEGKKIIEALSPKRKELVDQLRKMEIDQGVELKKQIKGIIEEQMKEALKKKKLSLDMLKWSFPL